MKNHPKDEAKNKQNLAQITDRIERIKRYEEKTHTILKFFHSIYTTNL